MNERMLLATWLTMLVTITLLLNPSISLMGFMSKEKDGLHGMRKNFPTLSSPTYSSCCVTRLQYAYPLSAIATPATPDMASVDTLMMAVSFTNRYLLRYAVGTMPMADRRMDRKLTLVMPTRHS